MIYFSEGLVPSSSHHNLVLNVNGTVASDPTAAGLRLAPPAPVVQQII